MTTKLLAKAISFMCVMFHCYGDWCEFTLYTSILSTSAGRSKLTRASVSGLSCMDCFLREIMWFRQQQQWQNFSLNVVHFHPHTLNHATIISKINFSKKKTFAVSTVEKSHRSWASSCFLCTSLLTIRNFNGSNPDGSLALADAYRAVCPGWYIISGPILGLCQWETSLQSNAVSRWLGGNLVSALLYEYVDQLTVVGCIKTIAISVRFQYKDNLSWCRFFYHRYDRLIFSEEFGISLV